MSIRFFNTYSRQLEEFTPLDPDGKTVKIYTCGPTVYNFAHIGNYRAYVFEDLLQRHLELRGYAVERVMNLTDVDDKTIRGSRAAAIPLTTFTQKFKDAFFEDLTTLRIKAANHYPSATEPRYIAQMIAMISQLMERGIAYQADDKSVYFRLSKFPNYGKLAHLNLDELRPTGRIANDEYEKENVGDFALWKARDEADGEVAWDSPWGRGRPGWHIECSAMATAILGPQLDIHCGGVDNIFPHHEAEIAQSESCSGEQFARVWMHCAHLMVEGQKMAKSLGNFYTLRDLLEKGWSGRELRYALLSVNYRLPLNFTFDGLAAARSALQRIDEWVARLSDLAKSANGEVAHSEAGNLNAETQRNAEKRGDLENQKSQNENANENLANSEPTSTQAGFAAALDDDLNISGALGHLFETIRETNRRMDDASLTANDADALLDWWKKINHVLALEPDSISIPNEVKKMLTDRKTARVEKNWAQSDALRDQITALGWQVKDTKDGQKLSKH